VSHAGVIEHTLAEVVTLTATRLPSHSVVGLGLGLGDRENGSSAEQRQVRRRNVIVSVVARRA